MFNLSNRDGMVALRDRVTSHETHNDTTVNCSARALKNKDQCSRLLNNDEYVLHQGRIKIPLFALESALE